MSNIKKGQKKILEKKNKNAKHKITNNFQENVDSNIYSFDNNEVLENLIKLSGNQEVYKELKEETGKIKEVLSQSKQKLENINLYEKQKSDIDIYQWNNLFNRSIPITAYVSSSTNIKKQNNKLKKEENKNTSEIKEDKKAIKYPIVLVDLTHEEIKKYLPPEPIGIPPSNVIRFQQLPFKGDSKNVFYFSNSFNDYYKMDFKEFIQRMPILKAKKRCKSAKLSRQIKETKKRNKLIERQRQLMKNKMMNKLDNLYIEKQYLSLSSNSKNIQPLMSSIHSQIYPGKEDELTKHNKLYFKTNKPLGSEKDINDIDFSINDREYQYAKEDNIDENINNYNKDEFSNERQESNIFDISRQRKDQRIFKNINKSDNFSIFEDSKNIINNNFIKLPDYKLIKKNANNQNLRALSAKKFYQQKKDILDINRNHHKFQRAMSAGIRHSDEKGRPFIHKVFLSSKDRAFYKISSYRKINEKEEKRVNSSSQISTYEGINNSLYENQSAQRFAFPLKNNHQIQNKIYQKINKRLKQRQYEKDKQKLEEFSRLIHLDDGILSEDFSRDKLDKSNNNFGSSFNSGFINSEKNKTINRPLSSYQPQAGRNIINNLKNGNNLTKPMTPKIPRYNKSNNNFRAISKKSSNENSKFDFSSSVMNTKHEFMLNNNNDKITLIYFNDVIENKPEKISEGKPIIKNDRIIVGANYYNRTKPQVFNFKTNFRNKKGLRRVQSSINSTNAPKLKDNVIIQEENL